MNFTEANKKIEIYINEVLDPFDNQINKKELNIKINNLIEDNIQIIIDWSKYQLILFHFI